MTDNRSIIIENEFLVPIAKAMISATTESVA